jgi:multicomponent Na+:H+ antiporter subunit D
VTDLLAIAPLLLPLALAAATAALWTRPDLQRAVTLAGTTGLLAVSIWLVWTVSTVGAVATQPGGWPAPFGITIFADRLSAAMVLVAGILALATVVFARAGLPAQAAAGGFYPLFNGLMLGVNGAFLTGDVFNLYVWFEVMLVCAVGLLMVRRTRAELDGAFKYIALNLFGTILFLIAVGLLYGATGTLNMADLARVLPQTESSPALVAATLLFLLAFGIKAGAFPLFFWLPMSYHTAAIAVSAIFAGLLTKVGVYAAIRVFTLLFEVGEGALNAVVAWAAAATMIAGVLGAVAQWDIRRILAFHIVSQIGYMMMGLAVATPVAIAAAVFYVVHHIIVKANLFFLAGAIERAGGSYDLRETGGLLKSHPHLGLLFLVPALSLAGLPPFSGFWAKVLVIDASFQAGDMWLGAVALAVGLLTLLSMAKIWVGAFWKPAPAPRARVPVPAAMLAPIAGLGAITVGIGLMAQPLVTYAERAAGELSDRDAYVRLVLGPAAAADATQLARDAEAGETEPTQSEPSVEEAR